MVSYSSSQPCQPIDLKKLDICQYVFTEGIMEDIYRGDLCCTRFANNDVDNLDPYWKSYPGNRKSSTMPRSSYQTCLDVQSTIRTKEIDGKTIFSVISSRGNERIHPRFACASYLYGPIIPNQIYKCLRLMPTPQHYQLVNPPEDPFIDPVEVRKEESKLGFFGNAEYYINQATGRSTETPRPQRCLNDPSPGPVGREIRGLTPRPICLYLHGSGVDGANKDYLQRPEEYRYDYYLHTYNEYWDNVKQNIRSAERSMQQVLCEPVFFFSNTKYYGWAHDEVQRHYCNAIELLKPKIVFTHSMANPIIAAGIARQLPGCNRIRRRSDDTAAVSDYPVYWESIQGLFKGSAGVIRVAEECVKPSNRIIKLAQDNKKIDFCAPEGPSKNVFQSNYWGLLPPYASMHPQFSNPAIGYGTTGVTPEFFCDHDIYTFSHTKAHYDGRELQIALSNVYTPREPKSPLPQLYLKVQFGFATSYTIFHFYTVLKRQGTSDSFPPSLYKFPLLFRTLYDSLTLADVQNLNKVLAKGMIVQLSICGEDIHVGPKMPSTRTGPTLECYPHTPAGRNHIQLDYTIDEPAPGKSAFSQIRFIPRADDLQVSARSPVCKPLMDVAYEYADGGLCGTSYRAMSGASMESTGLAWLAYFISDASTTDYTTEVFRRDRYNHLISDALAAQLSAQDGMVNIDTCSIRPFLTPFPQGYTNNPQDAFYQSTINHADGQCYKRDVSRNGVFSCTWQLNRIKYRVLPEVRLSAARPTSAVGTRTAAATTTAATPTMTPLGMLQLLVEYINSCLFDFTYAAAATSTDTIHLTMGTDGHAYLFFPKGRDVAEDFPQKRKQRYFRIKDHLKWLQRYEPWHDNAIDNICNRRIDQGNTALDGIVTKLMTLYRSGGETSKTLFHQMDVLIREINTLMNVDYNVPDTEFLHQLITYDQSAASMRTQKLKADEWETLQTFVQRSLRTIQMTIPFLNIRQLEHSYNLNVVQCLSGIGSDNCAYK